MFIGHFAAGFAGAAVRGAPSAPVLVAASQLTDIAFMAFVLTDLEHMRIVPGLMVLSDLDLYDYPWSHSLLGTLGWAVAFGALVGLATRRLIAAGVAGAVVLSHWLLDWLTHRPDMTIAGDTGYGLGLWDVPAVVVPLELVLFVLGLWIYARRVPPRRPPGRWLLIGFGALMIALQLFSWFAAEPPPGGAAGFAVQGLVAFAVIIGLTALVDRFRRRVPESAAIAAE
ncbi:MAG: hypothetical protein AAF205_12415 [Pseudomonadota bacterium]